jgi:drug/metabolite transporter (DMT)-like permease
MLISIVFLGWQTPLDRGWLFFITVRLLGVMAQYLMKVSLSKCTNFDRASLKYFIIKFVGVIAYFVWAKLPSLQSLTGISIIVGFSLYTLHRELYHNRKINHAS